MRNAGDAAERRGFKERNDDHHPFSAERNLAWGKNAPKLDAYPVDSAQKVLGNDFMIVDDASSSGDRQSRKLNTAVDQFNRGAADIDETRSELKHAKNLIYGTYGFVDDKEGRKALKEAREELRDAKHHFKRLARAVGDDEGADDIKEGRQDLRKADRLIGKALRQDRNYKQERALSSIAKAVDQLDGTDGPHAIERGLKRALKSSHDDNNDTPRRLRA